MSNTILIIGESGTGKSTSIRTLDPKETFIINVIDKDLPFRGSRKKYVHKEGGNYFVSDNPRQIMNLISKISSQRSDIKNIVIDDLQFVMTNEFMRRVKEGGFQKFNDIASDVFFIINHSVGIQKDINIFMLAHSELKKDNISKMKTVGELTDKNVSVEARVTVVLHTFVDSSSQNQNGKYKFITNHTGVCMAKSPMGMFDDLYIDNDLNYVLKKIDEYRNYDEGDGSIKLEEISSNPNSYHNDDNNWKDEAA